MYFFILLSLVLCANVIGFMFGSRFAQKSSHTRHNPLYMRCSCTHLSNKHNFAGCQTPGCACRVSHRQVCKYGEFDFDLKQRFLESMMMPELHAGGNPAKRKQLVEADEILYDQREANG